MLHNNLAHVSAITVRNLKVSMIIFCQFVSESSTMDDASINECCKRALLAAQSNITNGIHDVSEIVIYLKSQLAINEHESEKIEVSFAAVSDCKKTNPVT